jgi:hypothetical protein
MRQVDGRRIGCMRDFNGEHGALLRAFLPHRTVWFRPRSARHRHAALYHALTQCQQVHCVFVFDHEILDPLPRADRRVEFIRESLQELDGVLRTLAAHPRGGLIVLHAVARQDGARAGPAWA